MTIGHGFPLPDQPDKDQIATYRAGSRRQLWWCALCATVVGNRGEPSEAFRLRPSGENGTWSVSADRIFGKGDAMEQKNVTIALFGMIGVLIISNVYALYQINLAVKMIGLLVENISK